MSEKERQFSGSDYGIMTEREVSDLLHAIIRDDIRFVAKNPGPSEQHSRVIERFNQWKKDTERLRQEADNLVGFERVRKLNQAYAIEQLISQLRGIIEKEK